MSIKRYRHRTIQLKKDTGISAADRVFPAFPTLPEVFELDPYRPTLYIVLAQEVSVRLLRRLLPCRMKFPQRRETIASYAVVGDDPQQFAVAVREHHITPRKTRTYILTPKL